MKLDTLEDLLVEQVQTLYSTEKQLTEALPKMAEASSSPDLKKAFKEHTEITKGQLNRLEEVYSKLGLIHKPVKDEQLTSLIHKGERVMGLPGNPTVKDAALIAAAQSVEHYEIANYGSARAYARELGYKDVEKLLQKTLDEVGETDKKLSKIAEGGIFGAGINMAAPKE